MPEYRLYVLDSANQVTKSPAATTAETDAHALLEAIRLASPEHGVEIRHRDRLVCRVPPGARAAAPG